MAVLCSCERIPSTQAECKKPGPSLKGDLRRRASQDVLSSQARGVAMRVEGMPSTDLRLRAHGLGVGWGRLAVEAASA